MKIIINDNLINLDGIVATLEQAILHSGIGDLRGLAAAVNYTVVPRANWNTFPLKENDVITIIRATQGG